MGGISCFVLLQLCAQRFYGAAVTRCVLGGQVEDMFADQIDMERLREHLTQ